MAKLRDYFFRKIKANPRLHLRYLRLARALATHGINPPLTPPAGEHEKRWRDQGMEDSRIKPEIYSLINDSIEKLFQDVLPLLPPESNILEIGCNAGRALDYLFRKGFKNLTGIEIGARALETFKETFPETYRTAAVIHGNAVDEIPKLAAKSFDLVFTHSVLVNIGARHNHIFREICRICRGYILILESEGTSRAFPRNFRKMFEKNGFAMIAYRWLVWDENEKLTYPHPVMGKDILKNNTIRLFAPVDPSARGGGFKRFGAEASLL